MFRARMKEHDHHGLTIMETSLYHQKNFALILVNAINYFSIFFKEYINYFFFLHLLHKCKLILFFDKNFNIFTMLSICMYLHMDAYAYLSIFIVKKLCTLVGILFSKTPI